MPTAPEGFFLHWFQPILPMIILTQAVIKRLPMITAGKLIAITGKIKTITRAPKVIIIIITAIMNKLQTITGIMGVSY